jgi:hypothetical protein
LVGFGEIERKLAKLSMTTFAYRSSSELFYVGKKICLPRYFPTLVRVWWLTAATSEGPISQDVDSPAKKYWQLL